MTPTLTVDQKEFTKALIEYSAASKKDIKDILNSKALFVLRAALALTEKADPAKIEAELGVIGTRVKVTKATKKRAGRVRKVGNIFASNTISRFLALKALGFKPGSSAAITAMEQKILNRRKSSVGTERAGWVGAIRKFARAAGMRDRTEKLPKVKGGSTGILARDEWNSFAEIEYKLQSRTGKVRVGVSQRVVDALRAAFAKEAASMRDYIARKMQTTADRFNAA